MRFEIPNALLNQGLEAGLFSAAAFAIAFRGEIAAAGTFGRTSFDDDASSIGPGTLFDVASLTKPVVTASATLRLVEEGRLTLNQSVGKLLEPRFGMLDRLVSVEVHHLLTHTSGLPPIPRTPDISIETADPSSALELALSTPLLREPGLAYTYSDTGYMLLWEAASLAAEEPLADYAARNIFAPLGMNSSLFCPTTTDIAKTDPDVPAGIVHDPRARELSGIAGHAGLFSTATDLLRMAETIRLGGAPILSRASVARMSASQLPISIGAMSYGWFCAGNDFLPRGDLFSDEAFGHSGFTGCAMLIDPVYEASVVLLTNRVLNTSVDGVPFLKLRRQWLNAVAAAVTSDIGQHTGGGCAYIAGAVLTSL